jgi:hypothetical protein
MNKPQGGQGSSKGGGSEETRPAVLDTITTTQMDELERQFDEGNSQGWQRLVESYGWTSDVGQEVWTWFGERPSVD